MHVGTFTVLACRDRSSRERRTLTRLLGPRVDGPGAGAQRRSTSTSTRIATCCRVVILGVGAPGSSHASRRATPHVRCSALARRRAVGAYAVAAEAPGAAPPRAARLKRLRRLR